MVHHNGDKSARERDWPKVWSQSNAKELLRTSQREGIEVVADDHKQRVSLGAALTADSFLTWNELCPSEMETELYREA